MLPIEYCNSSGMKTESAQISDEAGFFYGIIVATDATNDQTFTFYDSLTATGTEFFPEIVFATATDIRDHPILLPFPVNFNTGCYISVSGSGVVEYAVLYRKKR